MGSLLLMNTLLRINISSDCPEATKTDFKKLRWAVDCLSSQTVANLDPTSSPLVVITVSMDLASVGFDDFRRSPVALTRCTAPSCWTSWRDTWPKLCWGSWRRKALYRSGSCCTAFHRRRTCCPVPPGNLTGNGDRETMSDRWMWVGYIVGEFTLLNSPSAGSAHSLYCSGVQYGASPGKINNGQKILRTRSTEPVKKRIDLLIQSIFNILIIIFLLCRGAEHLLIDLTSLWRPTLLNWL